MVKKLLDVLTAFDYFTIKMKQHNNNDKIV